MSFDAEENMKRVLKLFWQNCHEPWEQAIAPVQLGPHIYYVGSSWVGVTLLDTGDGFILIDSGMPMQLYLIFEGIRELGFNPKDIRKLLISHGHFDHAGAAKAIQEYTGADVYCSLEDLAAIEGRDPEALRNRSEIYHGVSVTKLYADDKPIIQGNFVIHTKLTAGHTPGTTSFFFQDKDDKGRVYNAALHGGLGLNTLTDLAQTEEMRKKYRRNLLEFRELPVDIVCSNHPHMAGFLERKNGAVKEQTDYSTPGVWRSMLDHYLALLDSLETGDSQNQR